MLNLRSISVLFQISYNHPAILCFIMSAFFQRLRRHIMFDGHPDDWTCHYFTVQEKNLKLKLQKTYGIEPATRLFQCTVSTTDSLN